MPNPEALHLPKDYWKLVRQTNHGDPVPTLGRIASTVIPALTMTEAIPSSSSMTDTGDDKRPLATQYVKPDFPGT
jgi:hypothetical protein